MKKILFSLPLVSSISATLLANSCIVHIRPDVRETFSVMFIDRFFENLEKNVFDNLSDFKNFMFEKISDDIFEGPGDWEKYFFIEDLSSLESKKKLQKEEYQIEKGYIGGYFLEEHKINNKSYLNIHCYDYRIPYPGSESISIIDVSLNIKETSILINNGVWL